jgi:hypothetical protein
MAGLAEPGTRGVIGNNSFKYEHLFDKFDR